MKQYRRNQDRETKACKFCGAQNLHWSEIAPDKFRLVEESGAVHDCRQFHDAKRQGDTPAPRNTPPSLLREVNNWAHRWNAHIPREAADELDDILDTAAGSGNHTRG